MKITGKYWFSGTGLRPIGIVIGEDSAGKIRGYIGNASGANEALDAEHISTHGSPVTPGYLEEILKKLKGDR